MMNIVLLSLATASISMAISMSKPFAILRDMVGQIWGALGAAMGCPYMVCHPVAFAMAFFFRQDDQALRETVVIGFAMVALSAIVCGLIKKAMSCSHSSACDVEG